MTAGIVVVRAEYLHGFVALFHDLTSWLSESFDMPMISSYVRTAFALVV